MLITVAVEVKCTVDPEFKEGEHENLFDIISFAVKIAIIQDNS